MQSTLQGHFDLLQSMWLAEFEKDWYLLSIFQLYYQKKNNFKQTKPFKIDLALSLSRKMVCFSCKRLLTWYLKINTKNWSHGRRYHGSSQFCLGKLFPQFCLRKLFSHLCLGKLVSQFCLGKLFSQFCLRKLFAHVFFSNHESTESKKSRKWKKLLVKRRILGLCKYKEISWLKSKQHC